MAGPTHENDAGFDKRVTAGGLHEILHKAMDVAPGIGDSAVLEMRVGFRPFTPGFLPVFGVMPGLNDVWVANGLGASGLTVGPYLGSELAKL
ncbi:FAD-dependent oxidoreductase, partial [Micrococcus sp. SIMBA_144]